MNRKQKRTTQAPKSSSISIRGLDAYVMDFIEAEAQQSMRSREGQVRWIITQYVNSKLREQADDEEQQC